MKIVIIFVKIYINLIILLYCGKNKMKLIFKYMIMFLIYKFILVFFYSDLLIEKKIVMEN